MNNKKLQILVPHYKETDDIVKPLLDSIEVQQNVDLKNDVGVIIVNDGSDVRLSQEFLQRYSFQIDYYIENGHGGVSATRNKCLDYATADYVMFCDADDMFYNACGLYIIFREIENGGFDSLVSAFVEEARLPDGSVWYVNHDIDTTFVHGKVHKRQFLIDNNIRWNNNLTIHEDSYFNCLCQTLASDLKYSTVSFYLWRWRDASVCRHDPKYILKTYNNMLDSNDALIEQLLSRNLSEQAMHYAVGMIYDAYFTMNKDEWLNQENKEYRYAAESRFKAYWTKYKYLHDAIPQELKTQIIMGIKNRMYGEGMVLETLTFNDWIKQVEEL